MGDVFLDFVCPQCGFGTRRFLQDIPRREFGGPIRYRAPLFHADIKCVVERCDTHATVHTLAESDKPISGPNKEVPNWTLDSIRCYEEHPVKVPLEILATRVTGPRT